MLDSYSAERQPVFALTSDDLIEKSIDVDRDFLPLSSGETSFARLGDGFTLFGFDADSAVMAAFARTAERLHVPLAIVADDRNAGRERYGHPHDTGAARPIRRLGR